MTPEQKRAHLRKSYEKRSNKPETEFQGSHIQKFMGGLATEPKEKIKELKKILRPTPLSADLSDIQGFEWPNGLEMPKITRNEILQTIRYL